MDIAKIALSIEMALGSRPILTQVREDMEFIERKPTGKTLGYRYEVACPCRQFEKVTIKVANEPPIITQEELDARNGSGDYVYVAFEGFEGRMFQDYKTKDNRMACTATKAVLVNRKGG